ncbi:MAG: hydrogenase nickel incorporation protein HypA [Elusimicrobiota bacterium]
MHEWALAEGVVVSALNEMKKGGYRRITGIRLRVGELQQMDMEAFRMGLKTVMGTHEAAIGAAGIDISQEDAAFKCRACGKEWLFAETKKKLTEEEAEYVHFVPEVAHSYVRCLQCGSPDFEVTRGRGVWLDEVEVE